LPFFAAFFFYERGGTSVMFESIYLPFDEDHLPLGQDPIETKSVRQLASFANLLITAHEQTGYNAVATVSGFPGVGKSIAVQAFLRKAAALSHAGFPACIEMRVKPDSTPKAFVEDLLLRLESMRAPRLDTSRYRLADRAAEIIVSHDIRLIFVDEAEQLRADGFEFLRYIYGKAGCSLILIGDGRILSMLDRQPKFSSRSPLHQDFLPPSNEEILQTVLPQLHFSHWVFDPAQPEDKAMGEDLWFHAKRSFRNLRFILQFASSIASLEEDFPCIDQKFLNTQVYPLFRLQARKSPLPKEKPFPEQTKKGSSPKEKKPPEGTKPPSPEGTEKSSSPAEKIPLEGGEKTPPEGTKPPVEEETEKGSSPAKAMPLEGTKPPSPEKPKKSSPPRKKPPQEGAEPPSSYDIESEKRHAARDKKKGQDTE
jgi:hypothetical protein